MDEANDSRGFLLPKAVLMQDKDEKQKVLPRKRGPVEFLATLKPLSGED
jgi:hypothetical protein